MNTIKEHIYRRGWMGFLVIPKNAVSLLRVFSSSLACHHHLLFFPFVSQGLFSNKYKYKYTERVWDNEASAVCARNRERSEKTRQEAGKRGAQVRWRSMSLKRAKRWNKKKKKKKRETKTSRGSLHFNIPGPTPPLSFLFGTRYKTGLENREEEENKHGALCSASALYI